MAEQQGEKNTVIVKKKKISIKYVWLLKIYENSYLMLISTRNNLLKIQLPNYLSYTTCSYCAHCLDKYP